MTKRKPLIKYTAPKWLRSVRKTFILFFWKKCDKCGYEIRFETMTHVRTWSLKDDYYFCNQCIQEKKQAIQLIEEGKIIK